jgi:hypothetical protein
MIQALPYATVEDARSFVHKPRFILRVDVQLLKRETVEGCEVPGVDTSSSWMDWTMDPRAKEKVACRWLVGNVENVGFLVAMTALESTDKELPDPWGDVKAVAAAEAEKIRACLATSAFAPVPTEPGDPE